MLRCLKTIKVLDPSEFNTIFVNLNDCSFEAYSLKEDKLTIGIFSEDWKDNFADKIEEAIKHFAIERVENRDISEYDLGTDWCSVCDPCNG